MTIKMPSGYSKYGALMGRNEYNTNIDSTPCKVHLNLLYITQGYDNGGAYWGYGEPLYMASFQHYIPEKEEDIEGRIFVRAKGRKEAKGKVLKIWPFARFYR